MDSLKIDEDDAENEENEIYNCDDQYVLPDKSKANTSSEQESSEDSSCQEFNFDDKLEEKMKKQGLNRRNVKTIIHELLNNSNVCELLRSNLHNSPKLNLPEEKNLRSKVVKLVTKNSQTFTEIALPDEDDEDDDFKPSLEDITASTSQDIASALDTTIESNEGSPEEQKLSKGESTSSFYTDLQQCEDEIKALNDKAKKYSDLIEDELIALRTRSKQSLHDTNLIELETAFKPPDVTEDMYLPLGDDDWHKWLAELMLDVPDTVQSGVEEDDHLEDPDYNFLASETEEHIDKDDFRDDPATRISRKEVQELLAQIENMEEIDFRGDNLHEPIPPPPKPVTTYNRIFTVKDMLNSKLQLDKKTETKTKPKQLIEEPKPIMFTIEQCQTLDTQMRQHIQLLTQVNILSRNNPGLLSVVQDTHSLLQELKNLGENNKLIFKTSSKFNAPSLEDAIDIAVSSIKKSESVIRLSKYEKSKKKIPISMTVAKIIANSSVFSFIELLPTYMGTVSDHKRITFYEAEDNLLVLGWKQMQDHFLPCHTLIHQYMIPTKTPEQIKSRLLNSKSGHCGPRNAVFVYKQSGLLPRLPKTIRPAIGYGTKVKNLLHLKHHWKPDWLIELQNILHPQAKCDNITHGNKAKTVEKDKIDSANTNQINHNPVKFLNTGKNYAPITPSIKLALPYNFASPQISPVIILPSVIPFCSKFVVGSSGQLQLSPSKLSLSTVKKSTPRKRKVLFNSMKKIQSKSVLKTSPSIKPSTILTKSETPKPSSIHVPPTSQHHQNNTKVHQISDELDCLSNSIERCTSDMDSECDSPPTIPKNTEKKVENLNKITELVTLKKDTELQTLKNDTELQTLKKDTEFGNQEVRKCPKTRKSDKNFDRRPSQDNSNKHNNIRNISSIKNSKMIRKDSSVTNTLMLKRKKKDINSYCKTSFSTPKRQKLNRCDTNPLEGNMNIHYTPMNQSNPRQSNLHNDHKSDVEKSLSPTPIDPDVIQQDFDVEEMSDIEDGKLFAKSSKSFKMQKNWKHKLKVKWRKEEQFMKKSGRPLHSLIGKSGGKLKDEDEFSKSLKESAEKVQLLEEDTIVQLDPKRVEKELLFAQGYLKRMEEELKDHPNVLLSALEVLSGFDQNQSPPMLFNKLSQILRKWPDLVQGFAPFLMPKQARVCGLFPQQQVYARARKFFRQLEIRFQDNLLHLNKILNAFRTVAKSGIYVEKEIKATILNLLKAEPFLQEEFVIFFDNEQPPESRMTGDFEEIIWNDDLLKDTKSMSHENIYVPVSEENDINEACNEVISKVPPAKSLIKKLNLLDESNKEPSNIEKEMDCFDDLEREVWDEEKIEDESEGDSDGIKKVCNDLQDISSQEILLSDIGILSEDALSCSSFEKIIPLGGTKHAIRNKDHKGTNSITRPPTPAQPQENRDSLSLSFISERLEQSSSSSIGPNLPLTLTSFSKDEKRKMPQNVETARNIENKLEKTSTDIDNTCSNNNKTKCQENVKTYNSALLDISKPTFAMNNILCNAENNTTNSLECKDQEDKVFKWSREEDGLLLMICRENGSTQSSFEKVGEMVQRSANQVSHRFNELMALISNTYDESDTISQSSDTDDDNDAYDS